MGGEYGMLSLVAYEDYAALEKEVERLKGESLILKARLRHSIPIDEPDPFLAAENKDD